jgi:hypothetical protein
VSLARNFRTGPGVPLKKRPFRRNAQNEFSSRSDHRMCLRVAPAYGSSGFYEPDLHFHTAHAEKHVTVTQCGSGREGVVFRLLASNMRLLHVCVIFEHLKISLFLFCLVKYYAKEPFGSRIDFRPRGPNSPVPGVCTSPLISSSYSPSWGTR